MDIKSDSLNGILVMLQPSLVYMKLVPFWLPNLKCLYGLKKRELRVWDNKFNKANE